MAHGPSQNDGLQYSPSCRPLAETTRPAGMVVAGSNPPFPKHPTSGVSRKGTRGKPRGGAARGSDSSTTVAESAPPPPLAAGSGATTTRSDRRRWHNKTMATRDCGRGRWLVARAGDRAGVGEAGASHANAAGGGGGGGQSSARRRG